MLTRSTSSRKEVRTCILDLPVVPCIDPCPGLEPHPLCAFCRHLERYSICQCRKFVAQVPGIVVSLCFDQTKTTLTKFPNAAFSHKAKLASVHTTRMILFLRMVMTDVRVVSMDDQCGSESIDSRALAILLTALMLVQACDSSSIHRSTSEGGSIPSVEYDNRIQLLILETELSSKRKLRCHTCLAARHPTGRPWFDRQ